MACAKPSSWLHFADSMISLFILFPSMLFYWRGIWDLLGLYAREDLPHHVPLCYWLMTAVGSLSLVSYATLPVLNHYLTRDNRVVYVIVTRVHMYVHGAAVMTFWRGVWSLADHYLIDFGWTTGLVGLCVCHVSLLLLMTSRSAIFTPFVVSLDTDSDILTPCTCLQTEVSTCLQTEVSTFQSTSTHLQTPMWGYTN
jgi:Fuseless